MGQKPATAGAGGALLGVLFVHIGLAVAGPVMGARWGLVLVGTGPGLLDMLAVFVVSGLAGLMGLAPAIMAYRRTLSDGLNMRL